MITEYALGIGKSLRTPQLFEHRVGWANAPVAWQSKMFELRDPTTGRQLFETISISLVRAQIKLLD